MIDQNKNLQDECFMARREKCPDCKEPAYCTGTENVTDTDDVTKITKRHFHCSNVSECGSGYVLVESFSHHIVKPKEKDIKQRIKKLLDSIPDPTERESLLKQFLPST